MYEVPLTYHLSLQKVAIRLLTQSGRALFCGSVLVDLSIANQGLAEVNGQWGRWAALHSITHGEFLAVLLHNYRT